MCNTEDLAQIGKQYYNVSHHVPRFDTGHSILEQLLCRDSAPIPTPSLPLSRLWPLLIAVACKYTGAQRLKVVKLLMRLVGLQSSGKSEGGDTVVVSKDRLELSALKPLWQLYTTLIKTYGEGHG